MESGASKSSYIGYVPDKDREMASYRFILMNREDDVGTITTEVVL